MEGNTYANEAFKPVKKLTMTLIYYFIKTADGKLLMNVEAMKDFFINKQKEEAGREEQLGWAPYPGPGKKNP